MVDAQDGRTITEGWRALEFFIDRVDTRRRFCSYLNDDPAPSSVLVFHGDGGNGKSLLLQHLRLHLCKRITPDNWDHLKSMGDEDCVAQMVDAEGAEPVPVGRLDFADLEAREGFKALLKLRRDLSGPRIRFPLFDYAVVTYLHKANQLNQENLRSLFPSDDLDFVLELASLIKEIPGAGLVVELGNLLDRYFGHWLHRYRLRRNLDNSQIEALNKMDHEKELIQEPPHLFARDLNATRDEPGAPARIVLLFDTHERFWGHQRQFEGDLYFERDEWLRRLVSTLDREAGIVVVVAGREVPKWPSTKRFPVHDLEPWPVGDLSDDDALLYLKGAGVADPALRLRLCEDSRVGPDQVHPFSLGLGADLALAAARRGATLTEADLELGPDSASRRQLLFDRLLRYIEDSDLKDAVAAVAACRSFDRSIYHYLGQQLDIPTSRGRFRVLTEFSFVRRSDVGGVDQYRIHDLLRRLPFHPEREALKQEANAAMERYYREQAHKDDATLLAETIYHANRVDWERGVMEWIDVFRAALGYSQLDRCRALLSIRNDLRIDAPAWYAQVSQEEGEYFRLLSRYPEARASYQASIRAHDQAAVLAPHNPEIYSNRGSTLQSLGPAGKVLRPRDGHDHLPGRDRSP